MNRDVSNGHKVRAKVPGDSRQAGFMLELPWSPYQDQNLAPPPQSCLARGRLSQALLFFQEDTRCLACLQMLTGGVHGKQWPAQAHRSAGPLSFSCALWACLPNRSASREQSVLLKSLLDSYCALPLAVAWLVAGAPLLLLGVSVPPSLWLNYAVCSILTSE